MKTVKAIGSILLIASVLRAESRIDNAVIDDRARAQVNVAAGRGARAETASVRLRDSQLAGTAVASVHGAGLVNVAAGSNARANLGSVYMQNSSYRGHIVNSVSGSAINVAAGGNAQANSSSVVMTNAGGGGGISNGSSKGIVINNVKIPFSQHTGQNINVAAGGRTSNKNSVVFK